MKVFNSLRILLLMCMVLSAMLYTACEETDENSGMVELLSFGPSGIKHGEKIKFIGNNLNKVTSIVFKPSVEIASAEFTSQTSGLIELIVPHNAEAGIVTMKSPQGDIETKTPLSFDVPVSITSITAEAKPGANITITGDLLNWVKSVSFEKGVVVTEFISQSINEMVVQVPMEAQSGFIIFSSGGTDPLTFASDEELVVTLPGISSLSPVAVKHTENLTINGTDLDLVTGIVFSPDLLITTFVSQSETSIVVKVPAAATKGKITLKQLSPVDVLSASDLTIVLPKGSSISPKPAAPGVDVVTIIGTDLDLVKELTLSGSGVLASTSFMTHSETEITFLLPEGTKSGGVSYTTIHDFSGNLGVTVVIPSAGPLPLAVSLYDETIAPGGGDWSWNAVSSDPASTEQFYSGDVSWKYETTSGGGLSSGGITPLDASGQLYFIFSLYGGAGTDGIQVAAILNDNWSDYNSVTLKEGEWTEYQVPLTNYPTTDLTQIVRFALKAETSSSIIYADRIGFDLGGPQPLPISLYNETIAAGGGDWSWEVVVSDPANTEEVYLGSVSWKYETGNGGGLSSGGITPIDASASTYFSFAIFGGPGTDGKQIACILNDNWTDYQAVTLKEGEWMTYKVPLSNYSTTDLSQIVRFALKVEGLTSSLIYADRIGFE